MKFSFVVSCLCVIYITVVATEGSNSTIAKTTNSKETEKPSYPKKVNTIKKSHIKTVLKKSSDITEKFGDLPADDLEFLKELDKQFKVHGEKVKIKVENKNVTTAKNNKRTIDGELGYGYHYDPPKFMFYPYSQQNIGSNDQNYYLTGDTKPEVSIEPSYSYELKPQSYVTHNEPQIDLPKSQQQQYSEDFSQKHQQYEEPVIVLRIPGPPKYATHLQMLLQKYLEIRAAQYLHILEEAEQGNIQKQHQLQQLSYGYGNNGITDSHEEHIEEHQPEQHAYTQQVQYDHQHAVDPQSVQYPEIDHVYHSYKHRHFADHKQAQLPQQDTQSYYASQQSVEEQHTPQNEHQQQEQQQYQQEQFHYQQQVQEQPQFYYTHQQQYAQPEGPPANTYQQVFLVAMTQPEQDDHESSQGQQEKQQQSIYVQDQSNQDKHSLSLPVAENNPRPTHTKVVFTQKHEHSPHDYQMYQLPSIKPNDRHAPTSTPDYHQDFQHQQASSSNYQQHYNAADAADTSDTANQQVVAITQRPYNYHAHGVKTRARGRTGHSRRSVSAKEADRGLQKIREYVREKLDAEPGSAVEFKTSQVIDGSN